MSDESASPSAKRNRERNLVKNQFRQIFCIFRFPNWVIYPRKSYIILCSIGAASRKTNCKFLAIASLWHSEMAPRCSLNLAKMEMLMLSPVVLLPRRRNMQSHFIKYIAYRSKFTIWKCALTRDVLLHSSCY